MSGEGVESGSAGQHRLHSKWAFWYQKKSKRPAGASWHDGITCMGSFGTAESFWSMYSHILRPDSLGGALDLMLFRDGIKPMWEDENNSRGGKLTLKFKKNTAGNFVWEETLLALIGEQLECSADICGVIMSIRYHDDTLSIWNRNADDEASLRAIKESLTKLLHLPAWAEFEYTRHRKGSSAPPAGTPAAGLDKEHSEHLGVPTVVDVSEMSGYTVLRPPSGITVNDGSRIAGDSATSSSNMAKGWSGWGSTKGAGEGGSRPADAPAVKGHSWGKPVAQPPATGPTPFAVNATATATTTASSWANRAATAPAPAPAGPVPARRATSPVTGGSAVKRPITSTTPTAPKATPSQPKVVEEEADGWQTVPMRK